MGSAVLAIMMELPLRLVSLVIILASNSLQQDYYDKYCDSYAAMRRLTPAKYRGLVMEGRKIYQLCGNNLSTLSYNRVCEIISPIWYCDMKPHDTTMGARIQEYAGMQEFAWAKNWVNSYDGVYTRVQVFDREIQTTLSALGEAFNSTADKLLSEAELNLKQISKVIQESTFDQFHEVFAEITCNNEREAESLNLPVIRKVFNLEGIEDLDDDDLTNLIKETKNVVSHAVYRYLIEEFIDRIEDLLQHLNSEIKTKQNYDLFYSMDKGKIPKLEHLFLRIYEEIRTDKFLQRLDLAAKSTCGEIGTYRWWFVRGLIEGLNTMVQCVTTFITENKKLDVLQMLTEFKSNFAARLKERADKFVDKLDDVLEYGIKEGRLTFQLNHKMMSLILPDCSKYAECNEILLENYFWGRYHTLQALVKLPSYFEYLKNVQVEQWDFLSIFFSQL